MSDRLLRHHTYLVIDVYILDFSDIYSAFRVFGAELLNQPLNTFRYSENGPYNTTWTKTVVKMPKITSRSCPHHHRNTIVPGTSFGAGNHTHLRKHRS